MKYSIYPAPGGPAPEVRITPAPDSADRVFLLSAHIWQGVSDQDREAVLAAARAAAQDFPDDALALKTLARAEMKFGDLDHSKAPLDRVLAADPDDVDALYLQGRRLVIAGARAPARRAALWTEARPWFARAYQRDKTYYPALYQTGLTLAQDPGEPAENTVNIFLEAHDLAPQVEEISLATARILIRKRRYAEAVQVLEPIAYAPHRGESMSVALALLARARTLAASAPPADSTPPKP